MAQDISIKISVDGSSGEAGVRRLGQEFKALQDNVARVERASAAATSSLANMGHVAAAAAAANLSLSGVARAADAWASINAQLKIAAGSAQAGAQAYGEVVRIAMQTGQAVTEVGNVYKRFADNATALGITQKQVADVTQTVAKAIALSGGSAASSQAALTQFGQALASGTLRGEELNSVLEQAPRLAKAIADGMGVPIGKLRELAEQGKITSDAIVSALSGQAGRIEDEFGKLPVTIGRAMTNLKTAWTDTVGSFEKSTGVFSTAAQGMDALARNMDAVATAGGVVAAVVVGKTVASLIQSVAAKNAAVVAAQALAASELRAAQAAQAAAAARLADTAMMTANAGAANALAAANTRLAAAQAGVVAASRGAMALSALGGPIGIVTTALTLGITAWQLWGSKTEETTREAARSAVENLDSIILKIQEMNGRLGDVTRKSYTATVAAAESDLKTVRAEIGRLNSSLDKMDSSGGQGRFSPQGREQQTQLNALAIREIALQKELGEARQRSAEVGTSALNKFIDANAVGTEKVRVKQEALLREFAQGIAATGGVLDLSNATHKRAFDALNAGLADAAKESKKTAGAYDALAERADEMVRIHKALEAETKGLAKAREEVAKADKEWAKTVESIIGPLEQQADALEREVEFYGMADSAIQNTIIARLEEKKELLAGQEGFETLLENLEKEIEARKRIASAAGRKEVLDANEKAAQQAAKDWENFARDIERSLTDSLYRAFESGEDFGTAFAKSLERTFKTMVLKFVVQGIFDGGKSLLGAAFNSITGGAVGSSWGGGGSGGNSTLGAVNTASSLYNGYNTALVGYQWATGGMSTANAAGTLYANATGTGLDGLLATNGAYGTASTAGTAGGSAAGASTSGLSGATIGWIAAIIMGMKMSSDAWKAGVRANGDWSDSSNINSHAMRMWDNQYQLDKAMFGKEIAGSELVAILSGNSLSKVIHDKLLRWTGNDGGAPKIEGYAGDYEAMGLKAKGGQNQLGGLLNIGVEAIKEGYSQILKSFDKDANLSVYLAAAMSGRENGKSPDQFGGKFQIDGGDIIRIAGSGDQGYRRQLDKNLANEAANVILQALEATKGLPPIVEQYLDSLKTAKGGIGRMKKEAMDAAFAQLTTLDSVIDLMERMGHSGDAMSLGLANAMGGIDKMAAAMEAYYSQYYDYAEQQARAQEAMAEQFEALNLVMPKTKAEFRALVDEFGKMGKAGADKYAALIQLAPAFANLVSPVEQQKEQLQGQLDQLLGNTAAIRERELSALDKSNWALQQRIWAIQDMAAIESNLAQVEAQRDSIISSILSEYQSIQDRIAGLMGNTASQRKAELDAADPLNRALLKYAHALEDVQSITQRQAEAQTQLTQAQEEYTNRLSSAGGSIANLIADLRAGTSAGQSFSVLAAQYRTDLAGAKTGDLAASERIAESAKAYIDAFKGRAGSQSEYDIAATRLANQLAALPATKTYEQQQLDELKALNESIAKNHTEIVAKSAELNAALVQAMATGFGSIDLNTDGLLTAAELTSALGSLATDEQLKALIAAVDTNGDGQISKLELLNSATDSVDENTLLALKQGKDQVDALMKMVNATINNSSVLGQLNATIASLNQALAGIGSSITPPPATTTPTTTPTYYDLASKDSLDNGWANFSTIYDKAVKVESVAGWTPAGYANKNPDVSSKWDGFGSSLKTAYANNKDLYLAYHYINWGVAEGRAFAKGGFAAPGWALVGEEGPELVNFSQPGRVYTANQTAGMLGGGNAELTAEIRALRADNQAQARSIVQLQSRLTKLMERWDTQGMPSERVLA